MQALNALLLIILVVGYIQSGASQTLSCPAVRTTSGWLDLFPLPCKKHNECRVMSNQHLCCKGFCTKGVPTAALKRTTTVASSSVDELNSSSSTSTTTSTTSTTTTTTSTTTTTTTTPSTTSSTTTTTTTTTPKPTTTTEPPRPFLQLLPIQLGTTSKTNAPKTGKNQKLVCPKAPAPIVLFPIPCETTSQCRSSSGPGEVCCDGRCVKGVPAPKPRASEQAHQPLLGVVPRECPAAPLGELLFEVQSCKTDSDCWPRVCCPDGTRSYCRTARARLDLVPVANRIEAPVRMFEQYLQCTPPPQFDPFPQRCGSSVDCFPNLCCAEGGKKHCRPPQRSLFSLLAGVMQRFG